MNWFRAQRPSYMIFALWLGIVIAYLLPLFQLGLLSEWLASFLPFLLLYSLLPILFLIIARIKWYFYAPLALLFFIHLISFRSYCFPQKTTSLDQPIRVVAVNVLRVNTAYDKVINYLQKEQPDLVFIQEIDAAWETAIRNTLSKDYPHIMAQPENNNFGVMLLSKHPFKKIKMEYSSWLKMPYYDFDLEIKEKSYHFIAMHTYPPISSEMLKLRNGQLDTLAKLSRPNTVIMGDFNTSTYSPYFSKLLKNGNLKNPRIANGFCQSWKGLSGLLWSNLDHILVGENIQYGQLSRGADIGSDHLPIMLEIQ